jgi:hypothetical protein
MYGDAEHRPGNGTSGPPEPAHLETPQTPSIAGTFPGTAAVNCWSQDPNIEPPHVRLAFHIQQ